MSPMNPRQFGIAAIFLGCITGMLGVACSEATATLSDTQSAEMARAETLYDANCALCHGQAGGADGQASFLLFPPARDFTRGRWKLASTVNGIPTDEDLVATLRRGMPGSGMPSWNWMPEEDLLALAGYVRELAIQGIAKNLGEDSDKTDVELRVDALARMTPGDQIDVNVDASPTPEILAHGQELYASRCAACHGDDGKGLPDQPRRDVDQTLNWARDFTTGILKGGATHEDLAHRILVGVHGTAMPSVSLDEDEQSALVAYVRSLIPEGSEDRLVQRHERIVAKRIEDGILDTGDLGIDWQVAHEVDIALTPLWWRTGAILNAKVSAVHDGSSIAIRVRWDDPTAESPKDLKRPYLEAQYSDALALQLTPQEHPPFFGMAHDEPGTNIWHWRAIHVPGADDLYSSLNGFPHGVGDWFPPEALRGVPLYQLAQGPVRVAGEAAAVIPEGMQPLEEQESLPDEVTAVSAWEDGTWQVVMIRKLESGEDRAIALQPGERVSVSFAIWNGAILDLRGQKSVTIWHGLELEP